MARAASDRLVDDVRGWAGATPPADVHARLARAEARLRVLETQIGEIDAPQ